MSDLPPPFDDVWFRFAIGCVIGAALGSFATMLAYRLPRHMSIIAPRSHCPSCGHSLGARDLVPIVSWVMMRGKCRYCGGRIGGRYVWIEVAITLICGLAGAFFV